MLTNLRNIFSSSRRLGPCCSCLTSLPKPTSPERAPSPAAADEAALLQLEPGSVMPDRPFSPAMQPRCAAMHPGFFLRRFRSRCRGGHASQRHLAPPPRLQLLIGQHAEQNHRPHHREVQGIGDTQDIHEVLQHLEQRRPQHDPEDRALAAAQAAPAQDGSRDRVELIKVAEGAR